MIDRAAIIAADGKIITVPRPGRHHNVIWYMVGELGYHPPIIGEQGFVNEKGEFLNRIEAKAEAIRCNQIIPGQGRGEYPELYSEDVWLGVLDPDLPGGSHRDK